MSSLVMSSLAKKILIIPALISITPTTAHQLQKPASPDLQTRIVQSLIEMGASVMGQCAEIPGACVGRTGSDGSDNGNGNGARGNGSKIKRSPSGRMERTPSERMGRTPSGRMGRMNSGRNGIRRIGSGNGGGGIWAKKQTPKKKGWGQPPPKLSPTQRCSKGEHPCRSGRGCCPDLSRNAACNPDFKNECCDSSCQKTSSLLGVLAMAGADYQCKKGWFGNEYSSLGMQCLDEKQAREKVLVRNRWDEKNEGRRNANLMLEKEDLIWAKEEAARQMKDNMRYKDPVAEARRKWGHA